MQRFCPGVCTAAPDDENLLLQNLEWSKLSLYDFRRFDTSCCERGAAMKAHVDRHTRCAELEDLSRIANRGWAIQRNMVPPEELAAMASYVERIPEPTRSMCGAGGYQPRECFVTSERQASLFPRFHSALTQMLEGWISSGFHEKAQLGWPLKTLGGEFIAINPWRRARTATCVMRSLFLTAHAHTPGDADRASCLRRCPSTSDRSTLLERDCALRCWWLTVMALPLELLHDAVRRPKCTARPAELSFLWAFSFGETSAYAPGWIIE